MQQAKLMEIERHLKNIKQSDDLSYSESQMIVSDDVSANGKQLIDEDTLLRLVDECKDEEARLSVMLDAQSSHSQSQICRQTHLTEIELDSFDIVARRLKEAEQLAIETDKIVEDV